MSFLRDLQSKSQTAKAHYAFGFASMVTGLIALVWMSTIPARFAETSVQMNTFTEDVQEHDATAFLQTAKSQLGTIIDWNSTEPISESDEIHAEHAPNMANLNTLESKIIYANDTMEIAPLKKETLPQEPVLENLEHNPGIIMPTHVTPQKMPEPTPPAPVSDSGGKKALIEITKVPPRSILIETKAEPQVVPQN